jgi:hypothetical protein
VVDSFTTRPVIRRSLCGSLVGVGPVRQAAQAGLVADLSGNERENSIQADNLAVQLFVCIGDHMVLFIGCHHQIREALSNTIEEESAVSALGRLSWLRKLLGTDN